MSTYGGRPEDRYGQPSDPWGQPDRSDGGHGAGGYGDGGHGDTDYGDAGYGGGYGQPAYDGGGYGQPAYDGGGYGQPAYGGHGYDNSAYTGTEYRAGQVDPQQPTGPGWQQPEPPERSSTRLLVTIVAVLAVLLVAGGAAAFFVTRGDGDNPSAASTPTAGPSGLAAAGAEQTPAADQTGTPAPGSSTEARFAVKGQCLVNDGTEAKPNMHITDCGPNTYQVLARFDGTIDYAGKCGPVKGYKFHYYFDAELDSLDFVLCLKKR